MKTAGSSLSVCRCLLALALAGSCGCMSYLHPVGHPVPELREPCASVPLCCRDHVYVFLVHGMDPCNYANLSGLRDYIQELGFNKTFYGQLYHTPYLDRELHKIYEQDPDARFVLIGFSFGANCVRHLANSAKKDGIPIALLVYLGGNTLKDVPHDKPDNVEHIVNILASGCIWNGDWMAGAENYHETNVWHFGSPTHPETLKVLSRNLARVAAGVSVVLPPENFPPRPADEIAPTPRPVMPRVSQKRDEWDFLKPVSRLLSPAQEVQPAPNPPTAPADGSLARQ